MTKIEIEKFKEQIVKDIMPYAKNMKEEQIHNIISLVEKENKDLPEGFGNVVLEQILISKYKL